jgi:hypothetical protein
MKNAKRDITPQQLFLVLQMFFGATDEQREPTLSHPFAKAVEPKLRKALIEKKVLRTKPLGRATQLALGEEANDFIMDHLGDALPKSDRAAQVLQAVLGKVGEFLQTEGHSLEEVFGPPLVRVPAQPAKVKDPAQAIRDAYLGLTYGEKRRRVRLADLRTQVGVSRPVLDATLLAMQKDGLLVLYKLDNPAEISEADRESALYIADEPRHVVYLEV